MPEDHDSTFPGLTTNGTPASVTKYVRFALPIEIVDAIHETKRRRARLSGQKPATLDQVALQAFLEWLAKSDF